MRGSHVCLPSPVGGGRCANRELQHTRRVVTQAKLEGLLPLATRDFTSMAFKSKENGYRQRFPKEQYSRQSGTDVWTGSHIPRAFGYWSLLSPEKEVGSVSQDQIHVGWQDHM